MVKQIVRATIWDELRDRFRLSPPRWQLAIVCGFIFCVLILFSCVGTGTRRIIEGLHNGLSGQQATQPTIQPYQFGERAQQDAVQAVRRIEGQQDGIAHSPSRFNETWLTPADRAIRERNQQRQQEQLNNTPR